jgi:subtilisin family serine protease
MRSSGDLLHVIVSAGITLILAVASVPGEARSQELPPKKVVALIDSGMKLDHPDLAANLWTGPNGEHGWDFVDDDADPSDPCYGHGTSTAGVLGAVRDNGIGIDGAAENVELMVLRVLTCGGVSTEQNLIDAVDYAVANGADIIQGVVFISAAWNIACWDQLGCVPSLCQAIANSGLLWVGPAGNEGIDLDDVPRYPPACGLDNLITVTASDGMDGLASFATTGSMDVAMAAPGVDILTTAQATGNPNWTDPSGYVVASGASYATPLVAARAVYLLQHEPQLVLETLTTRLLEQAEILPPFEDTVTGGRLSVVPIPEPRAILLDLAAVATVMWVTRRRR